MELSVEQAMQLAVSQHREGKLDEAEELYRLVLKSRPDDPDAMAMLGTLMSQRGFHDDGLNLIEGAIKLKPGAADFHANHGLILFSAGLVDAAINAYHKALELRADIPNVYYNLGNALQRRGQIDEAIEQYQRALALKPEDANACCNLGGALLKRERVAEAIAAFRRAVEIAPDYAEAMSNLGTALIRDKKVDEGIEWYGRAAALRPQVPEIVNNFAGALKDSGRTEEALSCYRRALALQPNSAVHSNLIYLLQFHQEYDGRLIAMELAKWNQAYALPLGKDVPAHLNYSVPDKRLKIGYVSPNFFGQAESNFFLPLLAAHDRQRFEIHCFSGVRRPDEFTERHRESADQWHDILRDDDQSLDKRIRESHIDILVDLTMHMGENRLLVFARKPAPVQVTWLAYPGSTGLTAMDYRLTDSVMDPPNRDETIYSEKSIRLPGCWVCYDPLSAQPQRPVMQSGPITFGSLNNPCKINPRTLRVWARIMREIPGSRLVILSNSEQQRVQIRRLFDEAGIKPPRIDFVTHCPREEYLRQYDRIDIGLDPLPYNGITTTCDALWMGVPVITQTGLTAASRAGASVLTAAGFAELIVDSPDRFVKVAVELGKDNSRLMRMRSTMRERVCGSALMDGKKFAEGVEKVYREIWTNWCEQLEKRGRANI
jgi:predicted O-linked N-acetylglucosamine transferase (SPINDLY family)